MESLYPETEYFTVYLIGNTVEHFSNMQHEVCYQNLIRICIKISEIKGLLSKWFTLRTYLSFHEVRKWKINWICLSFLKASAGGIRFSCDPMSVVTCKSTPELHKQPQLI